MKVFPGDVLHFVTWGGGGWGDPLERDPALVELEVRRGLVTDEGARRYGVVVGDAGVDAAATEALRAELRAARPAELPVFDMGPPLEELLERCEAETGLPAPSARRAGVAVLRAPPRPAAAGPRRAARHRVLRPGRVGRARRRCSSSTSSAPTPSRGGPFLLPDPAPAVAATEALVAAAREHGRPVVWTVVRYTSGLADGGLFVRKVPALAAFAEDADGGWGELVLEPAAGEPVIAKQYASAFFGTSLAATLHTAGIDTLVVAGVSTSGCIRATATDALNHGFRPQVVRDACADRTPELHDQNLRDLDAKYADVVDLDEALAHLRG